MAKFTQQTTGVSYDLPDEGQIFTTKEGGDAAFLRQGKQIYEISKNLLPAGVVPRAVGTTLSDIERGAGLSRGNYGQIQGGYGSIIPGGTSALQNLFSQAKTQFGVGDVTIAPDTGYGSPAATGIPFGLPGSPARPGPVSSSASIRQDLASRGVTDADNVSIPSNKAFEQFKQSVAPGVTKPAQPKFLDVYSEIRKSQGIQALEDEEISLESQKDALEAAFREFKTKEIGGVSQQFYLGRVSEKEQILQERMDAVVRQQKVVQMKVKNKNDFISDYMNFTNKDYDAAREDYEFEFNKALQMQTAFQSYKNAEEAAANRNRDDALATLNAYVGMIDKFGGNFGDFISQNPGAEVKIREMETRGGLIPGSFIEFVKNKTGAKPLATTVQTDKDGNVVQYFTYADENGQPGVVKAVKLPGAKKVAPTDKVSQDELEVAISSAWTELEKTKGTDGYIDPVRYYELRTDWAAANIGSVRNFDDLFSPRLSPETRARLFKEAGIKSATQEEVPFHITGGEE